MLHRLAFALALIAAPLSAQGTKTPRLPPANPVPFAPDAQEVAVMKPVRALLAALETSDRPAVPAVSRPEGGVTVALERPDGARRLKHVTWAEFAGFFTPGPDKFEERLAEPAIEIDGDIALVWAAYTSLANGKVDHCGYDHFDLVREAGAWKILNVTWSQRTTDCER